MVIRMKTTVEVSDELLAAAKETARREGRTLRSLLEEALRLALARRRRAGRYRMKDASFRGRGLQPGVAEGSWEGIRARIYEGRGG